jgi:hypothetical protein
MHVVSNGFTTDGSGFGFDFRSSSPRVAYDGSTYSGFTFWAKGTTTGGTVQMQVLIPASVPIDDASGGGTCTLGCDNFHSVTLALSDTWQPVWVDFCDLRQDPTWGSHVRFDPSQMLGVQFQGDGGVDFDVWVDDVQFYTRP